MKKERYLVKREPKSRFMVKIYDDDEVLSRVKRNGRTPHNRDMSDDDIRMRMRRGRA